MQKLLHHSSLLLFFSYCPDTSVAPVGKSLFSLTPHPHPDIHSYKQVGSNSITFKYRHTNTSCDNDQARCGPTSPSSDPELEVMQQNETKWCPMEQTVTRRPDGNDTIQHGT